jgi:hypothetical protein
MWMRRGRGAGGNAGGGEARRGGGGGVLELRQERVGGKRGQGVAGGDAVALRWCGRDAVMAMALRMRDGGAVG